MWPGETVLLQLRECLKCPPRSLLPVREWEPLFSNPRERKSDPVHNPEADLLLCLHAYSWPASPGAPWEPLSTLPITAQTRGAGVGWRLLQNTQCLGFSTGAPSYCQNRICPPPPIHSPKPPDLLNFYVNGWRRSAVVPEESLFGIEKAGFYVHKPGVLRPSSRGSSPLHSPAGSRGG